MSYHIVRFLALDWPATVAALRTQGADFYWHARDEEGSDPREERIPFVRSYEGPLTALPGWRDPEADWIYDILRKHLDGESRLRCDSCFAHLFWEGDEDRRCRDVLGEGCPLEGIWYALAPAT